MESLLEMLTRVVKQLTDQMVGADQNVVLRVDDAIIVLLSGGEHLRVTVERVKLEPAS